MNDVLHELTDKSQHVSDDCCCEVPYPMFVLTNESNLFGAACIIYPNLLQHYAAEAQTDFYILPSSIHEVILVPTLENSDYQELEWQKELEEREQKRLEAELRVKLMLEAEAAEREAELQRMEAAAKEAEAKKKETVKPKAKPAAKTKTNNKKK